MTLLDAEQLNRDLDRLREAGWQEAHYQRWIRETARDLARRASPTHSVQRIYLMGPNVLGASGDAGETPAETGFAQVLLQIPPLRAGADPELVALALEPAIAEVAFRELGRARRELGLAGT